MTDVTDVATEFAAMCRDLSRVERKKQGDVWLSERFGLEPWSADFYKVIFCILSRADEVGVIIGRLKIDETLLNALDANLAQIKSAFSKSYLNTAWDGNGGPSKLQPDNVAPISAIGPMVRQVSKLPKLSEEEIEDLIGDVDQLIDWLEEHQLKNEDFIRQAIIDGAKNFRFHLVQFKWVGVGYTIKSLREVIGAYLALEKSVGNAGENTTSMAMLKKVFGFLEKVNDTVGSAKDTASNAAFLLQFYGGYSVLKDSGIAGFLPS